MFACITPVLRLTGLTFTSTKPAHPLPFHSQPHNSVNFAGVRRPRVSSTQSMSIMLHHDPVMRARSGHRPSFFFVLFSLPFAVSVRLFSPCFSGQIKTFFSSMRPNRLAHRASGTRALSPIAPLAVNREMTTLSRRPSPLALRPSITPIR